MQQHFLSHSLNQQVVKLMTISDDNEEKFISNRPRSKMSYVKPESSVSNENNTGQMQSRQKVGRFNLKAEGITDPEDTEIDELGRHKRVVSTVQVEIWPHQSGDSQQSQGSENSPRNRVSKELTNGSQPYFNDKPAKDIFNSPKLNREKSGSKSLIYDQDSLQKNTS